jgi:AraC-like DNA-binding protein
VLQRDTARAILRPEHLERRLERVLVEAQGPLAAWSVHVWSLAWSVPLPASSTAVIPHPTVHLTLEAGPPGEVRHGHALPAALVHGVPVLRFAPALPAPGWAVGLHLRPGAVRDLTGTSARSLTGRVLRWTDVLPAWDLQQVGTAADAAARAHALQAVAARALAGREPSPQGRRAREVEQLVRTDRDLVTAGQLAARLGTTQRSLQRLCADHLGVTPRWLLRRARVLDAQELLTRTRLPLVEVAQSLGWYDQAHFTRDYAAVTGTSPARVRRLVAQDRTA